ncbi:MAG: hypothetical protein ACXVO1_07350 [Tumebacillaceae bacterium]
MLHTTHASTRSNASNQTTQRKHQTNTLPPTPSALARALHTPATIMQLQRTIGNRAVIQLLRSTQTAQLASDKDVLTEGWTTTDKKWETFKQSWGNGWTVKGLFQSTEQLWSATSQKVRSAIKSGNVQASDLQELTTAKQQMDDRMTALTEFKSDVLIPMAEQLQKYNERLQDTTKTLKSIDDLLKYQDNPNVQLTLNTRKTNAETVRDNLANTITQMQNNKTAYDELETINADTINTEKAKPDTYNTALTTDVTFDNAPINGQNAALEAEPGFAEYKKYTNLGLTRTIANHPFWQSLTLTNKTNLNAKLAGFSVAAWNAQGYPHSRTKQNAYTGPTILIPTVNGFPTSVSGEIVHDWIFNTKNHGHKASVMRPRVQAALTASPLTLIGSFKSKHYYEDPGANTVSTWDNLALRIVIRGGTLITYFDTN